MQSCPATCFVLWCFLRSHARKKPLLHSVHLCGFSVILPCREVFAAARPLISWAADWLQSSPACFLLWCFVRSHTWKKHSVHFLHLYGFSSAYWYVPLLCHEGLAIPRSVKSWAVVWLKSSPICVLLCCFKMFAWLKHLPLWSQLYGLRHLFGSRRWEHFVCDFSWSCRLLESEKHLSHSLHLKEFSAPWFLLLCLFNSPAFLKYFLQGWHMLFLCVLKCLFQSDGNLKHLLQCWHL